MDTNKIIVNGVFHVPCEGILLQKTNKKFLQLPGFKVTESSPANQIQKETESLKNYFYKITGTEFLIETGVSYFHFTSKDRKVRTYYMSLGYYDFFFGFQIPNSSLVFLPDDINKIRQNSQLLSDDKTILIYYLENQNAIKKRYKRFLFDIKAIA